MSIFGLSDSSSLGTACWKVWHCVALRSFTELLQATLRQPVKVVQQAVVRQTVVQSTQPSSRAASALYV